MIGRRGMLKDVPDPSDQRTTMISEYRPTSCSNSESTWNDSGASATIANSKGGHESTPKALSIMPPMVHFAKSARR